MGDVSAVWSCAAGLVVYQFGSGVEVDVEPGWRDAVDLAAGWTNLAEKKGGSVESIDGLPTMVVPAAAGVTRGYVQQRRGDVLLRVSGNGKLAVSDIVAILRSIR